VTKTLLALASIVAFAGCQSAESTTTEPPAAPADGEGVTMRIAQPDRLAGSYVDASGIKIEFETARSGDNLYMHIASKGHEIIHAETTADQYVFRYLDGRLTLAVDKEWIQRVQAEGDGGPAAQDTTEMHWTGDMAVLDEMIAMPEAKALPWMSRALGSLGYTGSEFPASLPMHKMARQSADALGIELPPIVTAESESSYCTAYPNSGNQCYGMCGNGCSCWSWVCGDCCYHSGCARHDDWCRSGQWYYCYNITAVVALFGC
jgi:hypothetical protein